MLVLITGGSGSGKSAYGEKYISEICGRRTKYYLATMRILDRETREKAEKHRAARSGKGFRTVEMDTSVARALDKVIGNALLLECMSNLTANEMFSGDTVKPWEEVAQKILRDMEALCNGLAVLVVVTNNVFEDGMQYDEATEGYQKALGTINRQLAVMADQVVEVVAGIPVTVKEKR